MIIGVKIAEELPSLTLLLILMRCFLHPLLLSSSSGDTASFFSIFDKICAYFIDSKTLSLIFFIVMAIPKVMFMLSIF
jgi:hypothetical protein